MLYSRIRIQSFRFKFSVNCWVSWPELVGVYYIPNESPKNPSRISQKSLRNPSEIPQKSLKNPSKIPQKSIKDPVGILPYFRILIQWFRFNFSLNYWVSWGFLYPMNPSEIPQKSIKDPLDILPYFCVRIQWFGLNFSVNYWVSRPELVGVSYTRRIPQKSLKNPSKIPQKSLKTQIYVSLGSSIWLKLIAGIYWNGWDRLSVQRSLKESLDHEWRDNPTRITQGSLGDDPLPKESLKESLEDPVTFWSNYEWTHWSTNQNATVWHLQSPTTRRHRRRFIHVGPDPFRWIRSLVQAASEAESNRNHRIVDVVSTNIGSS